MMIADISCDTVFSAIFLNSGLNTPDMKRKLLRKSDIKQINALVHDSCGVDECFSKKDRVEEVEADKRLIVKDSEVLFFFHENKLVPTIRFLLSNRCLEKLTVDMGAVKFVVSGADIMRPGIVEIPDNIQKDQIIAIVDENNKKPIAVGVALSDSEDMKKKDKGKVVKNIHWAGDMIWNFK